MICRWIEPKAFFLRFYLHMCRDGFLFVKQSRILLKGEFFSCAIFYFLKTQLVFGEWNPKKRIRHILHYQKQKKQITFFMAILTALAAAAGFFAFGRPAPAADPAPDAAPDAAESDPPRRKRKART